MIDKKPIRAGIVGAGYVSLYHIRAAQTAGVSVVAIADANRARAEEMARRFQIPAVYDSLAAMAAARPDVIHILTPPESHCALTLEALDMGCHVMVEKPMAEKTEDCDRMIARARETGRMLTVNHSARLDPIVLRGLDLVKRGAIGDVLAADFFRSSDYAPWAGGPIPPPYRNGAYPFQDLGVHALYLLEAFLGELRRVDVTYRPTWRVPNLCFDEWRAAVETDLGTGNLYISWNVRPMQNELVVHGTRGVLHIDCFLQTCVVRPTYPAPKPIQRILGAGFNSLSTLKQVTLNTLRFVTGKLRSSPGIHESVVRFYGALERGDAPPVPPEEGRRIVAWMEEVSLRADADKLRLFTETPAVTPPRILVTGSSGFLGSVLLRRLREAGESVRVLVRRPSPKLDGDPNLHVVYGDLGDPAAVDRAVQGVDTIYHVGAGMKGATEDFERGTVQGTRNVIDACLRHGVKRLVYVSSLSVLDHGGSRGAPILENAACEPHPDRRGAYTQTKLAAERLVLDAIRDQALPAMILRPGQIFGPGAEKGSPSGAFGIGGRWIVNGPGRHLVPLVYVDDVVDALLAAAQAPLDGDRVFHIVDPSPVTQRQYVERQQQWAAHVAGSRTKAAYWPPWLLMLLAMVAETLGAILKRGMPLTRYRVKALRPLYPFDISAARERLGWEPRVGSLAGLNRTFGK
jgi:2-alkyl-3-oxoalkanoate reductase